jgi:protein-tyrosine phosphatase
LGLFNFFSKTESIDFSRIGVDMHSHLIPNIDDGVKSVEESLEIIQFYHSLGYSKIITTPHVYQELYPNESADILRGRDVMRTAIEATQLDLKFEASAEYFLDAEFEKKLISNQLIPIAGKYLLIEFSFFAAPPNLEDYLFRIQTKGFIPIIAHPERYMFWGKKKDYEELKDRGCLLQVNILSLTGYYGVEVRKKAMLMIKEDMIDLLGTDTHHLNHVANLKNNLEQKEFVKIINHYPFQNKELLA